MVRTSDGEKHGSDEERISRNPDQMTSDGTADLVRRQTVGRKQKRTQKK